MPALRQYPSSALPPVPGSGRRAAEGVDQPVYLQLSVRRVPDAPWIRRPPSRPLDAGSRGQRLHVGRYGCSCPSSPTNQSGGRKSPRGESPAGASTLSGSGAPQTDNRCGAALRWVACLNRPGGRDGRRALPAATHQRTACGRALRVVSKPRAHRFCCKRFGAGDSRQRPGLTCF
jgi:hypothetical protein